MMSNIVFAIVVAIIIFIAFHVGNKHRDECRAKGGDIVVGSKCLKTQEIK